MAFEGAMKAMGSAKPKMAPKMSGSKPKSMKDDRVRGEDQHAAPEIEQNGDKSTTTIEHNADGTHTMDGETHPSHLHVLAALGHKLTGGDKHHVAHHDGMQIHTHGITEAGEHQEGGSHNSAEDAKEAMGNFFNEEAQEPEHQQAPQHGMGEYGG